jgi:hypothetical protein
VSELRAFRRSLYALARALGWVIAASRGPDGLARRTARVAAWRGFARFIRW